MAKKTEITRDDIMSMTDYEKIRMDRRREMVALKKSRRIHLGPDATFYFENFETMWRQIHEMLYIERGGEEQIEDEINAYNPLIPKGRELVATLMFEIEDSARREKLLAKLGGVEKTVALEFDGEVVKGKAEEDMDRTNAEGKASSVQFIHFPFGAEQIRKFKRAGTRVTIGIGHSQYGHIAVMGEETRRSLADDFV